jgi:DNA-binding CsgD family transcriptional regulator
MERDNHGQAGTTTMSGTRLRTDFISIIEAIYSVEQPATSWLTQIMAAAAPALDEGVGVGGTLYEIRDQPPHHLDLITGIGLPEGWLEVGAALHAMPELHQDIKRGYENLLCADLTELDKLSDNFEIAGSYYKKWNILGGLMLNGLDTTRRGVCLHLFSRAPIKASKARRNMLTQLSTHLATGYRLQQRLARMETTAPVEAVLTPRGRVEHCEPAASSSESRASLQEAVEQRRWSQGRARIDQPERAVAVWRGLVTGRWTLVDRYEANGQRYVLARQNTPESRGLVALSGRENQVAGLAALGRSNKVIAYELDLAHVTVRVLLGRAAKKLGVRSRAELVSRIQSGSEGRQDALT